MLLKMPATSLIFIAIVILSLPLSFSLLLRLFRSITFGHLFLTVIFTYAAFSVSRVRDIWDLDKMFSHRFCPNKTLLVSLNFLKPSSAITLLSNLTA